MHPTSTDSEDTPPSALPGLPSIFDADPIDLGGIYARQGFAYQDDVAAGYFLQMTLDPHLVEISCETHDDITLVWQFNGQSIAEFVQVKAEHLDQLWSVAKLCERAKSTRNPEGIGTSILEKSLARDRYAEQSRFRVVTCRQIDSDLAVLTRDHEHEHRSMSFIPFKNLADNVVSRVNGFKSKKENDTVFWLTNARWEVIADNDIVDLNQQRLAEALYSLGLPYDPETVRAVYMNICALAKDTAELGIEKWKEKRVSRDQLFGKLKTWIEPYPDKGKIERLEQKLSDAGLDEVCLNVAKDQQRFYLRKKRTTSYLNVEQAEDIEQQVLDVLHQLRSSLDSAKIDATGVEFHHRCLDEVNKLRASQHAGSPASASGYLAGCMYEITARCRHRFTRFTA